jgi:hypothetical protein
MALELLDEVLIQRPARDAIGAHLCKAVVLEIDVNVVDRRVKILIAGAQAAGINPTTFLNQMQAIVQATADIAYPAPDPDPGP